MTADAFIAELRARVGALHANGVAHALQGQLDIKGYGYSCGYLKALDDIARPRGKDDEGGIIEQIIADSRKE